MRTRCRSTWFLSLCSFLLLGCSSQKTGQHSFQQYLEEGVQVAENTGGPRYEGDLFRYEQVVLLVQDPANPGSLLYPGASRPWDDKGFLMDAEGWFYAQDRGNYRIAVFDPSGQYVHSIGKRGQGPGEFTFLYLTGISDDILEVYDGARYRVSFFRTDGTLIETLASPAGGVRAYFDRVDSTITVRNFLQEKVEEITMTAAGFRTFRQNGDTVGQAHTPFVEMFYAYYWSGHKGGVGGQDFPFSSNPSMAWAPDRGVYLITGRKPLIWLYSLDGTLLRKITLDLPEKRVTRKDRQRYTLDLESRIHESEGNEQDVLQAVRQTLTFLAKKSHWRGVTVDDQGYIWLEVPEWERDLEGLGPGCLYYLLSPEGEFLGSTRAPVAGKIMQGNLLGIISDPETGREDHIVWRLIPRAEGFVYP